MASLADEHAARPRHVLAPILASLALAACGGRDADRVDDGPIVDTATEDASAGCDGMSCPQTLAFAGAGTPMRLAVDATHVYWTAYDGMTISRAPITGGAAQVLATGRNFPLGIAVSGGYVYWSNYEGASLERMPVGGGTIETFDGIGYPNDISIVDSSVYVGCGGGVAVLSPDATSMSWVTQAILAQSAAASGPNVFADQIGSGSIAQVPTGGGPSLVLAGGRQDPDRIVSDGTTVYWAEGANDKGAVASVPVGGGLVTVISSDQEWVTDLAIDDSGVYWTDVNLKTVSKLARGATTPVVIASGERSPWGIALDATNVYWATLGDGTTGAQIRRLAK